MAGKVGDVMYSHQAKNQPDAWEFAWALWNKSMDKKMMKIKSWFYAVMFHREYNSFHLCLLYTEIGSDYWPGDKMQSQLNLNGSEQE